MAQIKKNIISLHGIPGSGKTKTGKALLGLLKAFSPISTGAIARAIALEHGFSEAQFDTFPQYARNNNIPYDELIDKRLKEINVSGSKLIVDSRLGYFFVPNSFKVLLKTPIEIAAQRIFRDPDRRGLCTTVEEVLQNLITREKSDRKKYKELYGTDYTIESNFDYVESTEFPAEEVANMIFIKFRQWYIND